MSSYAPTNTARKTGRRLRVKPGMVLVYTVMILITLVWLTPTVGLLVSSFRPADDVSRTGWWTVITNPGESRFTLDNYRVVLGLAEPGQVQGGRVNINLFNIIFLRLHKYRIVQFYDIHTCNTVWVTF